MNRYGILQSAIFLLLLVSVSVWAERDHDDIKRLRDAGEILPLHTILDKWHKRQPRGRILEAELELEGQRYIYELKILSDDGTVQKLLYDARTGEFLGIERGH